MHEAALAPAGGRAALLWAPRAWVDGRWREAVVLESGADGNWRSVESGVATPAAAEVLQGPALPGLVDAHSHAFQRAFAGLAEHRERDRDDFWSWRDGMYRVALRVTAQQQEAIATQLYVELLRGGFTHVCEFHYLHRNPEGTAYAPDPGHLAHAIARAARAAGIGLTLLPSVYERAGFAQPELRPDQRRFRASAREVLALRDALRTGHADGQGPPVLVGLALHSLRAASPGAIAELLAGSDGAPIHIHVAEQSREVEDCLAATGQRPIEWLCRHARPDRRWQLVHATHANAAEIDAIAACGAGVVLCPSTEANLGDGISDLPALLQHGVALSIGTDSQVARSAPEELRLLETAQRLRLMRRCVAAAPERGEPSTAARLWTRTLQGGAAAAGYARWGLHVGARADLLVVDMHSPALLGIAPEHLLDALTFSSPVRPFRDVLVAGRWVARAHHHPIAEAAARQFCEAMQALWGSSPSPACGRVL